MSTNYRNTQLTIGFHPTFAAQDAIGTPLPLASLTAAMNVVTRRHIQPEVRGEDVLSCNGRYKVGEVIFNRIARLLRKGGQATCPDGGQTIMSAPR